MDMKATKTPKGVWLSTAMMSAPLFTFTAYLSFMTPMAATTGMVDPANYAYIARTCLRMLGLNLTFFGGVHYGLGSAQYDVARTEEEKKEISWQIGYAFVPGILCFGATNLLLFAAPLTLKEITIGFSTLFIMQVMGLRFDKYCVKKSMAPEWFAGYRNKCFAAYFAITLALYAAYYKNMNIIDRKNDPNRIEHIKSALKLEDVDFVKMIDDMKL